jgi:crossover junction endodeoxyribonuclease RuvC
MGVAALAEPAKIAVLPGLILGVDPGLNTTGYGLLKVFGPRRFELVEAGIIRTTPKATLERRLLDLHQGLNEIITTMKPTSMALEQLYTHYQRPSTAILMGHARGVICLVAATAGMSVHHYAPNRIKKLLTGNGHSPKPQMQLAIKLQLKLATLPEPPDVADALAIALCHCHLGLKFT